MAIERENSVPKKGMNRDTHPSELSKEEYTFAMNTVISDENGNGLLILQNENSNIRCSGFKVGYKVLGHKYDQNRGKTYFFLKDPVSGCSEIGYIDTSKVFEGKDAIETECGCDFKVVLETPLEEETQVGYCTYNTLMTDCCPEFPNAPKCLNFDLQHPIHSSNVEIKDERTGYNMYFTDNYNPPRVVKLDEVEQYYFDKVSCEEPTPSCLQCEELRIFKLHNKPCITAKAIRAGGSLRAGTYEATMAYCDISGEEITDYQARTNAVPIFDKNNRILSQPNLDYMTDFSIEYEVENLDTRYLYFKVVIIRRNGLDGLKTEHTLGIYPTTTNLVIFSSLDGTLNNESDITQRREQYKKAKGISAGNGYLYQYGMKSQREINLQPVVNLMGGFSQWSTYKTKEDAYEDGAIVANYTGQMRDEVYPYSIKFYLDGGFETAVFPFIPRPPRPEELEEFISEDGTVLSGGDNVESIVSNTSECISGNRRYKWQFENTAQEGEKCLVSGGVGTVEYTLTEEKECKVSDSEGVVVVGEVASGQVEVPGGLDLISYINNNTDYIMGLTNVAWEEIQQELSEEHPELVCEPSVDENCEPPVLKDIEIYVISVDEQTTVEQPQSEESYEKIEAPIMCPSINVDPMTGGGMRDTNFETNYMEPGEVVYERMANTNTTCSASATIVAPTASNPGYHLMNKGEVGGNSALLTTIPSTPYTTIFEQFLHSNAVWFKIDFSGRDAVIFQLSDLSPCEHPDDNNASHIRASFYSDCSGTLVPTYSQVKTLPNMSLTVELSASDFPSGEAFIAIDSDIRQRQIGGEDVYTLRTPCSCFSATQRNQETSTEVSFTGMKFGKKQVYDVTCAYSEAELDGCKPVPHEKGEFSYWESVLKYPCNKELWKSDNLTIFPGQIPSNIRSQFETYYTTGIGVGGAYDMSSEADFQDKPIRHYKFPCSKVSPFMNTQPQGPFKDSIIYPIGFRLDNEVISAFLDIALGNNLITQEEREAIKKYEIFRGNRVSQRSIVAKGIIFDYYKYKNKNSNTNEDIYYPNYPLNTLGLDVMNGNIPPINSDNSNSLFAFHSPDTHFYKPTLPNEIKLEGYLFGNSLNYFDEVQGHPRYAVIGEKAEKLAGTLATAEVAFEIFLKVSEWATTGFNNPMPYGTALAVAYSVLIAIAFGLQSAFKWGRYREQWMETFRKLGNPNQFAYYSTSVGYYNLMDNDVLTGSKYRGIASTQYVKEGKWKLKNKTGVGAKTLNNTQREDHVMIDMGDYKISHPSDYVNYDNYSTYSSKATRSNRMYGYTGKSSGIVKNTAVPYVSLKNYLPAQYGTIDSVSWISTGYCGNLDEDQQDCDTAFGGDTYISRFSVKRKFPFFLTTAIGQPDNTPFEYSRYFNIPISIDSEGSQDEGELASRFYINYLIDSEVAGGLLNTVFPTNTTSHRLDFPSLSDVFYERPPSKFYLYSYGIPHFLVESTYNCNYRYAGTSLAKDFYPHHNDVIELTQQENVPIQEREQFYINDVYFNGRTIDTYRRLPFDYEKERYDKKEDLENTVVWSKIDSSEKSMDDPWLVYGALDTYDFNKSNGKLVDISLIENEQLLARFKNGVSVFGTVDLLADRFDTEPSLGTGGMFKGRNMNYYQTELGYAGTQNVPMVNCKFGHFWIDARRGKVFLMETSGGSMPQEITQGVSKWFKENLPFNILSVNGVTEEYIDNSYNGAGIAMVWDERNDRVILTKKDYRPLSDEIEYDPNNGFVIGQEELCPEGYTYDPINKVCFREELVEKQPVGESISVESVGTSSHGFDPPAIYTSYNSDGTADVDPLSSTGYTYESITNPWWVGGGVVSQRYVNLLAKWVTGASFNTWYGGVKIVDVPSTKTYYVALAADDEFRFSVDGVVILTSDAAGMNPQHNRSFGATFVKIHIYPIELEAGCRLIKVEGLNEGGAGLFSASILDNTYSEIVNSSSQADLNEIYSTQHITELFENGFTMECPENSVPQGEGLCDECLMREEVEPDINIIELGDERYFKECSWTVSYSPLTKSWISYHSYKPNYYIGYNDYFQSGVTGTTGSSLWSHIPFNSSYQVFYGTLYPFTVEYPVVTKGAMTNFNYIEYWLDIRKYYNKHDFSDIVENGFNKAVVYKNDQNTGQLEMVRQTNNDLSQSLRYPQYNANSTEVLQTEIGGKWSFNFLYNRIKNEKSGLPLWLYDCSNVEKLLNNKLIDYRSTYQDRLRGDYFLVRLTQDVNSRFKYMFRYAVDERNYYNQ